MLEQLLSLKVTAGLTVLSLIFYYVVIRLREHVLIRGLGGYSPKALSYLPFGMHSCNPLNVF